MADYLPLSEITEVITKGTTPSTLGGGFVPSGINFVKVESISDRGVIIRDKLAFIDEATHLKLARSILKKDDILFSIAGAIGRTTRIAESDLPANTNQALAIIRVAQGKALVDYVHQCVQGDDFIKTCTNQSVKSAQANVSLGSMAKACLYLPPLDEQRKIAEILRTWDEAIETAEAELGSLVRQLNGLLQDVALKISKGKAPSGWIDKQIGDLVVEVDRRVEWDDDMTYKLVSCARRSGGIFHRENKLGSEIAVKKMQEIRDGDFILSRMQVLHGGWAMVNPDFAGYHVSDMYMILEPRAERLHMPYFDWISRTSWIRHLAYLASYGVHIEKMTFVPKLFLKAKIRIPDSIAEQQRIVSILDGFSQKIEVSRKHLELLHLQKRGLMQKLLTGEVRVAV